MCSCRRSDAWRCAVDRNLFTVSCHCDCHHTYRQDWSEPPKPLPSQYELALTDWRLFTRDIAWHPLYPYVEGDDGHEVCVIHFAQDLSGEDQPPFSGWFCEIGKGPSRFFTSFAAKRWRLIV